MNHFKQIDLLVYDFDGVMTDNTVIVDQFGNESVRVSRADGLAISEIKKLGIRQLIISTEKNVVVQKRAEKLNIPYYQGINDKRTVFLTYLRDNDFDINTVAYVGNDINDYEVMIIAGLPIAPADAHESIKKIASLVTTAKGGEGVIRELYDIIRVEYGRNN